ncbi:uncharacterized protein N7443_005799 [Penicillium atrosanguineum]|uniref:Carotenoid oxygenase n=1 Tax=Penicillium atrosanguineum TaxID=1132637 RepID=A0A9W9U3T5_9EURO|nr:uncharacterized protein N7443_005799 [Penicillium atrosanguineum]KAJ5128680.1 hypothetical protein N7526_006846 [Penicillium atrosanguineum]KAJ5300797.1 hypothetical protein N7443_005799 [Penicillium atrosanguineum]KAJ5311439.1 hypothetical protein N7476_007299 [Penicillium atrosanguineum]
MGDAAKGQMCAANKTHRGNFAPIHRQLNLEPCTYSGTIPVELHGGQYVRNGGNPSFGDELTGHVHMFDGDGMLSGVLFRSTEQSGKVEPCFVNRYILTDVFLATKSMPQLRSSILPSIATLIHPADSAISTFCELCRFLILIIWSQFNFNGPPVRVISVANTAVLYHDKITIATCQTGPPMRVQLPNLETIGWYNGNSADHEQTTSRSDDNLFGRSGLLGFLKDWTTAHPRVDYTTGELISFQSSFLPPFVWYSVIPSTGEGQSQKSSLHASVPGISDPKLMHDFGVSPNYTVILDLPMSLDPINMLRGRPIVHYDQHSPSRFGVFPRHDPGRVRWFKTEACFIFHTASTWDELAPKSARDDEVEAVNMVACRYTSADMLYSMGAIDTISSPKFPEDQGSDSRLYYYRFVLSDKELNLISHQWALSAIPFEMPVISPSCLTTAPTFIYGCSSKDAMFGSSTGEPMKVDCLVKIDIKTLIRRGIEKETKGVAGCVDERGIAEILQNDDDEDSIKIFQAPEGWYAQEPRFVPRHDAQSEDDGYLLTLMFDETQLNEDGAAPDDVNSELWIIEARDMTSVVAKIFLPQRVPYGFHGTWFTQEQIEMQRSYRSSRTEKWANL